MKSDDEWNEAENYKLHISNDCSDMITADMQEEGRDWLDMSSQFIPVIW